MTLIPCPECDRELRPCNLARHRKTHAPRKTKTTYGGKYKPATKPIRLGKKKDRRYDDFVPRGMGPERYRLYRLRAGDLQLLATAANAQAIGLALVTLHGEEEFAGGDDSVGILDTATEPGHWIVSPFTLGRRREDE